MSGSPSPSFLGGVVEAGVEGEASLWAWKGLQREESHEDLCRGRGERGGGQSLTVVMINAAWALHEAATVPSPACCRQGSAVGPTSTRELEECEQILSSSIRT